MRSLTRSLAGILASSPFLRRGKELFERNCSDWNLSLSKFQKLQAGGYIILRDHADGLFPPVFEDQQKAYQAEMDKLESLPGTDFERIKATEITKPFWSSVAFATYASNFARLWRVLDSVHVRPPARLLELGCGSGWMAEFFAIAGYSVVGTSIAPTEISIAEKRVEALCSRGIDGRLVFQVSPMERVDETVAADFDGVYIFEALHHAFDWRRAIAAAHRCLKPGGCLVLANEPNVLHTFIAYRAARLSNTHEIGFSKRELCEGIARCGFRKIRCLAPRFNNLVSQHWVVAQKTA